jgi:sensor histidine kinase YesM
MSDEKSIYWLTQVVGWFLFLLLIIFQNVLSGGLEVGIIPFLIVVFVTGIGLSHFMRFIIIQFGLLEMRITRLLPRVLSLSFATGLCAALIIATFSDIFFTDVERILVYPFLLLLQIALPFCFVFLIWNVFYIATIYLKNYEKSEVRNLRLTASMTEVELGGLRSQLNPHFLFNALNSIRALVDENPDLSKKAITKMSNILRASLTSGKRTFVPLSEEMRIVKDYLDLEKIRFEERLSYEFDIPDSISKFEIPPLMIQTLVENGVKHGISTLPEGGVVRVEAQEISSESIQIRVINTGAYTPKGDTPERTGIGLRNSRRRLNLLYGDKGFIDIFNIEGNVHCCVNLPKQIPTQPKYENVNN